MLLHSGSAVIFQVIFNDSPCKVHYSTGKIPGHMFVEESPSPGYSTTGTLHIPVHRFSCPPKAGPQIEIVYQSQIGKYNLTVS